ncbi:glycosyltransferase family A protein [Pukyongiella litopenaei]|uniref:glycosyltransferase family A protein n=1 Tax=Pukyongiella litopenaei TaxID=2605946 RepID=UPI001B80D331|nr:glycosyltransferase family A protein [Pukyongiella litopenaei]
MLDGLRPLCSPIQLTRQNWRAVRDILRPVLVIVDAFTTSADGRWSLDDLSNSAPDDENSVAAILRGFKSAGVPTVFWNTFDVIYANRLADLARTCDVAVCSDGRHRSRVYGGHLPPACAPSVQSALAAPGRRSKEDRALINVAEPASLAVFDGWANLVRNRSELSFLDKLGPKGLAIVDSRYRIWANQKEALGELGSALLGCVTRPSLWSLMRKTNIRLASTTTLTTEHEILWDTLEAASCGTATALRGNRPKDLPKAMCHAYKSDQAIVDAVHALGDDPVEQLVQSQHAWRHAMETGTFAHRLDAIFNILGLEGGFAKRPLVTVLCATFRTEYIGHILSHFDAQTYPSKELVMVVNSSSLTEAKVREIVGPRKDVRISVVPAERVEAGSLNHGIAMAQGEYIVKMDDDDIYGPHYVSDMMHHALSHDLDLFGKTNRFFYFTEQDASYMRHAKSDCTMVAPNELMATHIGGASLSGRRDFFRRHPYREGNFSATDSHYYANLENHVADNRVAVLDDTGFLYRRRSASEHSWTVNNDKLMSEMSRFCDGILERILD